MNQAGVGILAGCDGLVPGFCLADELQLLVRSGLSPLAALQTATLNPVRWLGLERALGTIERGKAADLVLLDANPLNDIGNVRRIAAVVRNGTLFTRADLDAILQKARDGFSPGGSSAVERQSDREAVRLAAVDYLEGFYEGDSTRIANSVRSDARKIGYFSRNMSAYEVEEMPYAAMIAYADSFRKEGRKTPATAPREVIVGDVNDQTATAKVVSVSIENITPEPALSERTISWTPTESATFMWSKPWLRR
jgi:hypothetical protein